MGKTLFILGKGPCRGELAAMAQRWPEHEVWTLNNFFKVRQDPKLAWFGPEMSDRHFDVHYDQRHWEEAAKLKPGTPFVVSPFRSEEAVGSGQLAGVKAEPFPLDEVAAAFGLPVYIECTLGYMIALALLQVKRGEAQWERIALPGCDMGDATHFAYRFGTHYWLGIARGMGLDIVLTRSSHLLRRYPHLRAHGTEEEFLHIYGQPWSVTEPLREKYGWS